MLSAMAVVVVTEPLVPLTVTVVEPCAVLEAVSVNFVVQEPGQLAGANVAVTPLGSPEAENAGLAPTATAAMVLVTDRPGVRASDAGLADRIRLATEAEWYSKDPRS